VRRLVPILLVLPACSWDWDRFDVAADGAAAVCRWDDPGAFTLEAPRPVTEVNSTAKEVEPFLAADRLTLYFASDRGDGLTRSYRATRSTPDGAFDRVVEQSDVNVANAISRFSVSSDGLTAYIAALSSYPASATGMADLFSATRASAAVPFTSAQFAPLTAVNTAENEWDPFPAPDGLRLYYVEHTPSQSRNLLMVAERSAPGQPWTAKGPVPGLSLAPSKADNPTVTADERLIVFSSDLDGSVAGSRDLWYAVRAGRDEPFGTPRQLPVVNTEQWESEVYITPDGCELYFVRVDEIYFTRYVAR
jgi:hypothetical protein